MNSNQNFKSIHQTNTSSFVSSVSESISDISKSTLKTFQNSFQSKLSSLQSFQSELQTIKDKKEITMEQFELQKQQLQTLIVEIASFLDDLMLPIIEENPFYLEDFLMFIDDFVKQVETQFRLFNTLSVSSLRNQVRKQIAETSQKFETIALKESFEAKQKQTLVQTELLLETLNEQLIDIRHRIEKQKDKIKDKINRNISSLPSLSIPTSFDVSSLKQLNSISETTLSNFELVKQDIKRFFM